MTRVQRSAIIGIFVLSAGLSITALRIWAQASQFYVEIRRTSYGIPYIEARDEKSLGYGIGYSYAEDNLCLLANEVVTVNGERSKYFSAEARADDQIDNLTNDFFFHWFNSDGHISSFLSAQKPEIRDLLRGYAAGYNRYLRERRSNLSGTCSNQAWVREITERDLAKLIRRLTAMRGVDLYKAAIIDAAPPPVSNLQTEPALDEHRRVHLLAPDEMIEQERSFGSNAIALGRTLTYNRKGLLLGNPHYPWSGALRFYEMHLAIPGKLDVMGAALPGFPAINIGFSQHVAWSHTVDTSEHFTIYHLQLDPNDSTKYIVDGQSVPMRKSVVHIEIRQDDGSLKRKSHSIYETAFGPLVMTSNRFPWNDSEAFALQDANFGNSRALEQWYSMDSAKSLTDFRAAIENILGIPWVNTIATDTNGNALFMNVSAIPHVDKLKLAECSWAEQTHSSAISPTILDGSRAACDWKNVGQGRGLFASAALPVLLRDDFVQNSNGSAWMTNPRVPIVNFSPLISQEAEELNARTRFALNWLEGRTEVASKPDGARIYPQELEDLIMGDQVYLALLVMDDVSRLCQMTSKGAAVSEESDQLKPICDALDSWDRTAKDTANIGYVYFERFMQKALKIPNAWAFPFNVASPLSTPRGLNITDPHVADDLRAALLSAQNEVKEVGISSNATWGQIQISVKDGRYIPVPGGNGLLGVYNAIQSTPFENGHRVARAGSSYIQVVSFTDTGPIAKALLTFSESSNPSSEHYSDQTDLLSKSQWVTLPFSKASILSDPNNRLTCLRER